MRYLNDEVKLPIYPAKEVLQMERATDAGRRRPILVCSRLPDTLLSLIARFDLGGGDNFLPQ